MRVVQRLLKPTPVQSFDEYLALGGGGGLRAAQVLGADAVIDELEASGLRGRGGAGFLTARKWRTVRANASLYERTSVVVNAAEGEPGTFKDRAVLRNDPYQVLEGALIAARVLDADQIVIATKHSFEREVARLTTAITEVRRRGWCEGVAIDLYEGPNEYLFGEETALLETIDGRYPFPRIAPPYRRGVQEVVTTTAAISSGSGLSAPVVMAGPHGTREAPPALVNNVETLANVTWILAQGPAWFRHVGTTDSPGTMICTVTGSTRRHGVAEVPLGSSLRDVLAYVGGGARPGRRIRGVLPGVANALITDDLLDTPVSYEAFAAIGSGLGSAGFIVFDDHDDVVALVAGASHFLSVESCGQCTPCKTSGLSIAGLLGKLSRNDINDAEFEKLRARVVTVADSARCGLAGQQQNVIGSLLARYAGDVDAHRARRAAPAEPALVAELVDLRDGVAVVDERHASKQPDWSYDAIPSGKPPAARFGEHRDPQLLES